MGVELPEEACPCQEESSRKKRKHNDEEEKSSSLEETYIMVDTEALLVDSRSDLVLEKAQTCSEINTQIQDLNGNCDQSGESNCLPLKKRQIVQESGDKSERIEVEYIDVNNGILRYTKRNETTINNGKNKCGVNLLGEMALCLANQEDGTQEVEVSKSSAFKTEENKDHAEVQIAEECKSLVDEVSEATSNGNGGALPLPSTASQENQIMEVDTDKKEAILSAPQILSKDDVIQNDTVSKEDACQPLLKDSSHASAPEDSKKKLLILDLNGLLADIIPYCNERYKYDFEVSHKYVYKRPHVDDFLQFCFERFAVAIWSSRTKRNIDPLLELLIGPLQTKLLFCWDQSHCTQTRFPTVDNKEKPLVFKELFKVWENYYDNLPWKKVQYNESNTLLLDDSPYKALLNPSNTAIFPFSYRYTRIHDNSLGPGGDLRLYLEGLAVADNVQDYVKNNPFGQKPITESDPSWHYYQKVLRSYPQQDYTKKLLHNDAGKWSHRDDAGKWSHRDDAGKWSHRYDAGKWSHGYDARRWSHRDDGRTWSRGSVRESRHVDARKFPRDEAREPRRDYAGKSTKVETRESETRAVGEFTSTTAI